MKESLVKIISDNESCTGWFFHPLKPYIVSCGHFFEKSNISIGSEFSIIFNGNNFRAKLLSYTCDGVKDFSISLILDKSIKYSPIPISFESLPKLDTVIEGKYQMLGYSDQVPEDGMPASYTGEISGINKGHNQIAIYELSDRNTRDKSGVSGGPVFLFTKNRNYVIGFNISQNRDAKEALVCFSITNLFHLKEFKEVKQYYSDSKYVRPIAYKGIEINSYRRHAGIFPINNRKFSAATSSISREISRRWSEFINDFYDELSLFYKDIEKFSNILFSKDVVNFSYNSKGKIRNIESISINNVRILIDLENKFHFDNPEEFKKVMDPIPQGSHLIGIILTSNDFIESNNVFEQIIGIKDDENRDIVEIIFEVIKDILVDIFFFNRDIQNLPEKYPTLRNKKEFSLCKVKFALENSLLPYGIHLKEDAHFVSIASLTKDNFQAPLNHNDFAVKWRNFIEDFIPKHPELAPSKTRTLKPNEKFKIIENIEDIYLNFSLRIPVQYRGQLKKNILLKRLAYHTLNKSPFFFVFVHSKPKKEKVRRSICQLFGKKKFHVHLHDVFLMEKLKHFEPFKDYFLIIKYDN